MVDMIYDIETNGLSPFDSRVCVIGLKMEDEEIVFSDPDEKKVLEAFWQYVSSFDSWRLVGFNSSSFDLPFLVVRSFKHGIVMPRLRYRNVDLRLILSSGDKYAKGKLDDYAKLLDIPSKLNNWSGAHAVILWQEGKYEELSAYVMQDVKITYSLYVQCKKVGLI